MLSYIRRNMVAFVALFVAIILSGGTVAYAANTVRSSDIVDGQVERQDLAPDAVASGKILDGSVRGVDIKPNSIGGVSINESTLGQVPNALTLNGVQLGELRHYEYTARDQTDQCTTQGIWSQCGKFQLTVPAGHTYVLTVWSSVTVEIPATAENVEYCPAVTGPTCIAGGPEQVTLIDAGTKNFSTTASTMLTAGSYTVSTALQFLGPTVSNTQAHTATTIDFYDAKALASPN